MTIISKIIFRAAVDGLIDFKSFSTVVQTLQDDRRIMMRGSQKSNLSSLKQVCQELPSVPVNFEGISLKYPENEEILHKYGNIRASKNNSRLRAINKKSGPAWKILGAWSPCYPIEDSEEPSHSLMVSIFVSDVCPFSQKFEHKAKTRRRWMTYICVRWAASANAC